MARERRYHPMMISESRSPSRSTSFGVRIRMILFFCSAIAMMVIHDRFCRYLHMKPLSYVFPTALANTLIHNYYLSIGNTFAVIAKIFMCSSIIAVFAQLFWLHKNRKGKFSMLWVDNALEAKDDVISSLASIRTTFWLSSLTFISTGLTAVAIVAPSALQLGLGTVRGPCTVSTVNLTRASLAVRDGAGFYERPIPQLKTYVNSIFAPGIALRPNVTLDPFSGYTNYTITFDALALLCDNITSTFDFTNFLPAPSTINISAPIPVWNGQRTVNDNGTLSMTFAARELVATAGVQSALVPQAASATRCTPVRGTYRVEVFTDTAAGSPYSTVRDLQTGDPLSVRSLNNEDLQLIALADALFSFLNGSASYDPLESDFTAGSPAVVYSTVGAGNFNSPWSWSLDILRALPFQVQSISKGILSTDLESRGVFGPNRTTLVDTQTVCDVSNTFFLYNPLRLFLSYGTGLFITAVLIVVGFVAIQRNGGEESLRFSSILQAIAGEDVFGGHRDRRTDYDVLLPAGKYSNRGL